MNRSDIVEAAQAVITLVDEYHNGPHREMLIDPVLYAHLTARHGKMRRQFNVPVYGSQKPKRIDYRFGGSNPVVLELAVRPPGGGGQLYGSQNVSELRKLCRVSRTKANLRALLLLDLYRSPHPRETLKSTYDVQHAGPGKFERNSVRVIYVHRTAAFDFLWRPFKPVA